MTSNGDGWVILPHGTTRPHDDDEVRRYKSDGNYRWAFVARDELALRWSCGHMGDIEGGSTFEVVKLPVDGCTPAQLEAVWRIETEEIGASGGAFGLNPEIIREREHLLSEVASAIPTCPASGETIEWTLDSLKRLMGFNGLAMPEAGSVFNLINRKGSFDQSCDGREAQVVRTYFVGECGVVEALAYDKYGQWNLALRYRKRKPGEEPPKAQQLVDKRGNLNVNALSGLFGGVKVTVENRKKR